MLKPIILEGWGKAGPNRILPWRRELSYCIPEEGEGQAWGKDEEMNLGSLSPPLLSKSPIHPLFSLMSQSRQFKESRKNIIDWLWGKYEWLINTNKVLISLATQDLKYLSTESHMKDQSLSRERPLCSSWNYNVDYNMLGISHDINDSDSNSKHTKIRDYNNKETDILVPKDSRSLLEYKNPGNWQNSQYQKSS